VLGSKLDGTGFENEQIGHIQVAFGSLTGAGEGAAARPGVAYRLGGVDPKELLGVEYPGFGLLMAKVLCFGALGNSVTFADDFKKPA
jgi:hypothetical protein